MNSVFTKTISVITLSLAALTANAGLKVDMDVGIGETYIRGAVGSVHNSESASEYIFIVDNGNSVTITASDASGTYKNCVALDAEQVASLRSVNSDTYIYAIFNDQGVCTSVTLYNGSLLKPKAN